MAEDDVVGEARNEAMEQAIERDLRDDAFPANAHTEQRVADDYEGRLHYYASVGE